MRKVVLLALICLLLVGIGCNWAHIGRHIQKIRDDLAKFHEDVDRLIFDMEWMPAESASPYPIDW